LCFSGEPGIGKSRIAQTVVERISTEPHTRLRYFCSPHHQDSALYPSIAQLERAAGFRRDDTDEQRLDKLEAVLARGTNDLSQAVPLLAHLLSIPTGDRYPPLNLTPQKRKEKTLHAQVAQVEGLATQQPVLMVWEDVHWSDPTTRESLDLLIDRVPNLRVLVILTFRPEFTPPWIGRPDVTILTLSRLPPRQRAEMIGHLTGGRALPREIADQIVDRTDGVPLFIEELTKSVVESGLVAEAEDQYIASGPVAPLAVPTTLHASLLARLDRLAPAREAVQIGAALGRSFSHELICAVAQMPKHKLDDALAQLVQAELIFRRGTPPDAEYTFKHALVQDAAYSTLLRSQRQGLHGRIANVLEQKFPEIIGRQPETLAHHYSEAGLVDLAIEFWRRAGVRNVDRSAHYEAVGHFGCALNLLANLPPGHGRDDRELELTLALAVPLIAVYGFGSRRVEDCAVRAKDLSDKLHGSPRRFAAQRVAWNSSLMRQPVPRTLVLAKDFVGLAEEDGSPAKVAVAHRALGYSLLIAGEFREAAEILARGATLADTVAEDEFAIYGEHPSMVCRVYAAQAKILMGFPESGARLINASVAHGRRQNNPHSLAWALGVAAYILQLQHEPAATIRLASEALDTARKHRLPQWLALAERSKGWAIHWLGDFEGGLHLLRQGVNRWYETGAALHTTACEISLAESYLLQGQAAAAQSHLAAARAHSGRYGENYLAAEINRLEALVLQCEGATFAMIEECLATALATARQAEARLFELRSATALARLMAEQHERRKAVDTLARVYNWFTEGLETTDLKEAKALLDELA
jgi:hypothetical protein